MEGKVKWFNDAKGFGFIESKGKDYFVYFKDIIGEGFKTLKEGDKVEFKSEIGAKGHAAKDVRKI